MTTTTTLPFLLWICLAALGQSVQSSPDSLEKAFATAVQPEWSGESRRYDFWIGEWDSYWSGPDTADYFSENVGTRTRQWVFPVLDGKALVELAVDHEDFSPQPGQETYGFSVRYYSESRGKWVMAQDWPSPNATGLIVDQLVGNFNHGRIELFSSFMAPDSAFTTRRYIFSDIAPDRFRWERARTVDEGRTWRPIGYLRGTRLKEWPELGDAGTAMPNNNENAHCNAAEFAQLHPLEGTWTGRRIREGAPQTAVQFTAARFNGGCAVMGMLNEVDGDLKVFRAWTYNQQVDVWSEYRLDNRHGTDHVYSFGGADDGPLVLEENPAVAIESEFSIRPPIGPSVPRRRTSWTGIGSDRLELVAEERGDGQAEWHVTERIELERSTPGGR